VTTDTPEALVKIWFGFLQMAIECDLPLNEDFYASWGTREELSKLAFNRWWLTHGKALFEAAVPTVTLESATDDYLLIKIPISLKASQVKQQVSSLIFEHRGKTKRVKRKPPLSFTGDVEFKRLKQYERYLEVEFDPKFEGKTIEHKTEGLREVYRKIKTRLDKQQKTLKDQGKRADFLKPRDDDEFDLKRTKFGLTKAFIRSGIDAKKVGRWRLSGQHLLLNVAGGQFPGRGYYGSQLRKRLRDRLSAIGLDEIKMVSRHKGGRKVTKMKRKQKEIEAQSLKAYGVTSNHQERWK
jgi:hypothetical protein